MELATNAQRISLGGFGLPACVCCPSSDLASAFSGEGVGPGGPAFGGFLAALLNCRDVTMINVPVIVPNRDSCNCNGASVHVTGEALWYSGHGPNCRTTGSSRDQLHYGDLSTTRAGLASRPPELPAGDGRASQEAGSRQLADDSADV
jgi:hypothetical protein